LSQAGFFAWSNVFCVSPWTEFTIFHFVQLVPVSQCVLPMVKT
jgi:hypothetical protein